MDAILPFTPADDCTPIQLVVVTCIYGGVLFSAAGMIGDGSELLLLVPAYADLVGSVVLPVLGAVPDGMMVLFSGLGPRLDAQDQVSVGVGALAGSTIMLLTMAWFCGAWGGRVSIDANGQPKYTAPKLDPPESSSMNGTGYKVGPKIRKNAIVMIITCILYGFVQIPALMVPSDAELAEEAKAKGSTVFDLKSDFINKEAMIGLGACVVCFFAYLYLQTIKDEDSAKSDGDKLANLRYESIKNGKVTLRGAMEGVIKESGKGKDANLLEITEGEKGEVKRVLKPFFTYYDADRSGSINRIEFSKLMSDLREPLDTDAETNLFKMADVDNSGMIEFNEFVSLMIKYLKGGFAGTTKRAMQSEVAKVERVLTAQATPREAEEGDEDDEEEEEEMPEDLQGLTPEQQQRALVMRSCWQMGIGTVLVLVFSDPAVDVLNEIGKRTGIPAFYVSFVLAPFASNASELVATYKYGSKKTVSSMTISLSTLLGAACMNNTFCLAIFYALVWLQRLCWTFTAEVAVIVLVQILVGIIAMKSVMRLRDAYIILSLYPLSLVFVWVCNNIFNIP
ncbi:unnamed protein product [Amoebophrya sp. A120]|nr:unnamed protein product [Amoebophrya sp. A120]|eukprot:GSA120T00018577001.1